MSVLHVFCPFYFWMARATYRERLRHRLAAEGNFVAIHLAKKHVFDWRPVGPTRHHRAMVRAEFAPMLMEVDYTGDLQTDLPPPVKARPLVGQY